MSEKRTDLMLKEIKYFFLSMAERTGTLWENTYETASCNHGIVGVVGRWIVYGELNGSIHFHALIYIPEGEMIGELVKKREYSTKRGERRTRYGNTFFDDNFGMSDFQEVNPILLKRGGTSRYLEKHIMKSGEKALYSRGTPAEIVKNLVRTMR